MIGYRMKTGVFDCGITPTLPVCIVMRRLL